MLSRSICGCLSDLVIGKSVSSMSKIGALVRDEILLHLMHVLKCVCAC